MKTKKILSLLLAALLLLSVLPVTAFATSQTLALDTPLTLSLQGEIGNVIFTPETSGIYEFEAVSVDEDNDPVALEYVLKDSNEEICSIIDNPSNLLEYCAYFLIANESYVLELNDLNQSASGFTLTVKSVTTEPLELDGKKTAIPESKYKYYTFTPDEDGDYMFYSQSPVELYTDPCICDFVDSSGNQIFAFAGSTDDYFLREFKSAYSLLADETYTVVVKDYGNSTDGFDVTVSKYYDFTGSPTVNSPNVNVTYETEVKSYQWYDMTEHSLAVTDDEVSYIFNGSAYNEADGKWSAESNEDEEAEIYFYDVCYIPLKAGDVVTVESDDEFVLDECFLQGYDGNTIKAVENGNKITFSVEAQGDYALRLHTSAANSTFNIKLDTHKLNNKLKDETSANLEKMTFGGFYACEVTYSNGIKIVSDYLKVAPEIITQPTAGKPTVEVTYAENVTSYQWYGTKEVTSELTIEDVGILGAIYDEQTGEWSGISLETDVDKYSYMLFFVFLREGDILTIESSDIIDESLSTLSGPDNILPIKNGTAYDFVVEKDGEYVLDLVTGKDDSTFKIKHLTNVVDSKLDGQTTATLTEYEKGKYYLCEVTYNDGTVLTTDYVKMIPQFIKHPTAENPMVEVNFPEDVESYQWYEYITTPITAENATPFDYNGGKSSYDSETGFWSPITDEFDLESYYFVIKAKAGEIIKVSYQSDVYSAPAILNTETLEYFEMDYLDEDNNYEIEILEDGEYCVTMFCVADMKAWIKSKKLLEGQTSDKITKCVADKEYLCAASFNDGSVIYSDSFVATKVTEFIAEAYSSDVNDKAAQAEIIAKAEELLKDESLTEEEIKAIMDIKTAAEKNIAAIEAAEKAAADRVTEMINALPDTITKDDIAAVNAAKAAYDALSDAEKALIDPLVKAKLDAAVKAAEEISKQALVSEPSAPITQQPDSKPETQVAESEKPADITYPKTGDNSNIWLWVALALLSGSYLIGTTVWNKKRKSHK